jgi:2-phospho-L-lactate transferase/gluconeogenesis factor (CofD/UPF0052 family)
VVGIQGRMHSAVHETSSIHKPQPSILPSSNSNLESKQQTPDTEVEVVHLFGVNVPGYVPGLSLNCQGLE